MDDAPQYDEEEEWFINAFQRLDKSRPQRVFGSGYIPIPISEYAAYFSIFSPIYELDTTIDILQAIDYQVCETIIKANQAKAKQKKQKFSTEETPERVKPQ